MGTRWDDGEIHGWMDWSELYRLRQRRHHGQYWLPKTRAHAIMAVVALVSVVGAAVAMLATVSH